LCGDAYNPAMRCLSLALLALVACGESGTTDKPTSVPEVSQKTPKTTPAATTGAKVFQRDAESIANDLKRLEKQGRPSDGPELARFEREVALRIQHIDLTLVALEQSIKAESRQIVQKAYAILRAKQGGLIKQIDELHRETMEIKVILNDKAKGTGDLPPGFTEDELKDRLADLDKKTSKLRDEESSVIAELDEKIKLLKGNTIPEQGETVLTKEREVFQTLRARAEKLQQKS
jgi:hypothetical protein